MFVVIYRWKLKEGMEAQFRAKGESAHAGYAGRSFTWTASLDEILSPNDLERVLVFKAPAVDEKWTVHLVFSLATSKVAGVKQGDRVEATAKFQERMVDDENKVITYWFADGTAKLARTAAGNITLFAFDAGEELSEHSAPFDALAITLSGSLALTIGGVPVPAAADTVVLMPANVPHAVRAVEASRMLLIMLRDTPA